MSPWSKTGLTFAVVALIAYLVVGVLLYLFQRTFIYFPVGNVEHSLPTERFKSDGEIISVISINQQNDDAILYFGGNAEMVVGEAEYFDRVFPDYAVYLVNYRGYADSTGVPTEYGLYADAENIFDQLSERHKTVSAIGRSLGSGVATHLASVRKPDNIILVTPFDSIQRLAQRIYPVYPMSLMLKDKFDSVSRVPKIDAPVLIIAAEQDYVIPRKNTQSLFDAFPPSQVKMHIIQNSRHNTVSLSDEYYQVIHKHLTAHQN